jgi:hypothetical protein
MNALEEYRTKNGKSFTELARMVGLPIATVHRHCSGDRGISLSSALIYNKRLRIPFARMVETGTREAPDA